MNSNEIQGRRLVGIISLIIAPVKIASTIYSFSLVFILGITSLIHLIASLVLCYFMYQGRNWARNIMGGYLLITTYFTLKLVFYGGFIWSLSKTTLLLSITNIIIILLLFFSSSVNAFFKYHNASKEMDTETQALSKE